MTSLTKAAASRLGSVLQLHQSMKFTKDSIDISCSVAAGLSEELALLQNKLICQPSCSAIS